MTTPAATAAALDHLESMANLHPELSDKYTELSTMLSKKLYHQLTSVTLDLVNNRRDLLRLTAEGVNGYLALYDKVILSVDKKLNQLTLARIASSVANSLIQQQEDDNNDDGVAAKAVLENLLEKKERLGAAASLYAAAKLGLLTLTLMERQRSMDATALESTKDMLKEKKVALTELSDTSRNDGDMAVVHSAYYECAMTYRKAVGPPEAYYREAIQYLAYTSLDSLSSEKQLELATDLCVAALTGEGVYNFGEVAHNNAAILASLEGTPNDWLVKLIHASANGDVTGLDQITTEYATQIQTQPALLNRATLVKEKITLLALVNMVFERPSNERTLNFADIADRIQLPQDQVELVIIRALSLGLIKGSMDQIDETVHVTWVMPRVLDNNQLSDLAQRFGEWAVKVNKTKDFMDEHMPTFA